MNTQSGLSKVLVATDISDSTRRELDRTTLIALNGSEMQIKVVCVLPNLSQLKTARAAQVAAADRLLADEDYLRDKLQSHPKIVIESELLMGQTAEEIVKVAKAGDFELIVLGAQTKGRNTFFGSTAEKVAQLSTIPTLLVATNPTHAYERPLLAVTDTASETLSELISSVVDGRRTPLIVLHAWHIPFEGMLELAGESAILLDADRKSMEFEAQNVLDTQISDLKKRFAKVEPALREGDAASAILNEIQSSKVDLVVMRPHDRPVWLNSLMGSVARAVIASADCDILLAKHVEK